MSTNGGTDEGRPMHPIGVVAERTGLSTDLVRVWERRYGVVDPVRDDAGRRLYTDADIERLRLLERAVAGGRSIGRIAELSDDRLAELVRGDAEARWETGRSAPGVAGGPDALVERALERVRALDAPGLLDVLERASGLLGLPAFLETVMAPLFRAIGENWHAGRLGVVHEHMATEVALPLIARLRDQVASGPEAPLVVVGTPVGERHGVGAMLVAAAAAAEGWRVLYLGTELPADELIETARETGARAVALSLVYGDPEVVDPEVEAMASALDGEADVLIGGAGLDELRSRLGDAPFIALDGLDALRRHLRSAIRR